MTVPNPLQEPTRQEYTYPLALLSDFPAVPEHDRLADLFRHFNSCLNHVFFDQLPIPELASEQVAPPLRFGAACLSSVSTSSDPDEATALFSAGTSIWPVMVEVDNGLARSVEMLLAVGP